MLAFNGAAKRAVTKDSTEREVPSSKVALTYSHPTDNSEMKWCEGVGRNGPAADELGDQLTPVTTPAESDDTPMTAASTVNVTLAKLTSLTYTCAVPSPTPTTLGRAATEASTDTTEEAAVWNVSSLTMSMSSESARSPVLWKPPQLPGSACNSLSSTCSVGALSRTTVKLIACEKLPALTVAVTEPLDCASPMMTELGELVCVSSDKNRSARRETLRLSPLKKAVFNTGVLVVSWPKTPTAASSYCVTTLPCSVTRSPLPTPETQVVPPP